MNKLITAVTAVQNIKQRDYWLNKLSGELERSHFPYETHKINHQLSLKSDSELLKYQFEQALSAQIVRMSNGSDVRLFMILTAGLTVLIYKYIGSPDVILGTSIYKQELDVELINRILALRNYLNSNMTFKDLLLQVKQTHTEAVENQDYPFETLAYKLNLSDVEGEFSLFETVILLENIHDISYIENTHPSILFHFNREDEILECRVEFDSRRYTAETVKRIGLHLENLLRQALANVETKVRCLEILSSREKQQLLYDFNAAQDTINSNTSRPIPCLFAETAAKNLFQIALDYEDQQLTFNVLQQQVDRLALALSKKFVNTRTITALMLDKSLDMVISLLAVLKIGAAYLPILPGYPRERIRYIFRDSRPWGILTQTKYLDELKNIEKSEGLESLEGLEVIDIENPAFYVSGNETNIASYINQMYDPAYVMYTSGTTGNPKGILIEHRSVVNTVTWFGKHYDVRPGIHLLQLTDYTFDPSVEQIFGALVYGASLYVVAATAVGSAGQFARLVEQKQIYMINFVPTVLKQFLCSENASKLESLKVIISGGEKLADFLKNEILEKGYILYNQYGPTEITVDALAARCFIEKPVVMGKPITNCDVYVLGVDNAPVPIGVPGELNIAGSGLARGYLNNPELTAEKFISHPFKKGKRLYRSGDMVKWHNDGNIEFIGRSDRLIKIRGHRIESEEIENQLLTHPLIKEAVVRFNEDIGMNAYLTAYFIVTDDLDAYVLRKYLQDRLPSYMIPSYFMKVENIPLTPNGKIDWKNLPEPQLEQDNSYSLPRNETEKKLIDIWTEILEIENSTIGIDANFFRLGGHSLNATILISRIHKSLNVHVPLAEVFKQPTVRGLAEYIRGKVEEQYESIEPGEKKEYYELSSAQKRLFFLRQLDPDGLAYNIPVIIPLPGDFQIEKLSDVFKKLIKRHDSLRTSFHLLNNGPVQKIHDEVKFEIEYLATDACGVHGQTRPPGGGSLLKLDKLGDRQEKTKITDTDVIVQHSAFSIQHFIHSFIRPFDLSKAPLMQTGLLKNNNGSYILLVDIHHIITDGTSHEVLKKDFMSLYKGESLPSLRLQYKDFAQWQNSNKENDRRKRQELYWLNEFPDEIPVLAIPTDYPRPLMQSFAGNKIDFEISAAETGLLHGVALQGGATLFMVLAAVLNILLAKLSGQEDIIIGTPVAGRRHADLEKIIGMFVNTLALRNFPHGEKTFPGFLEQFKDRTLEAFENQEYPFDDLVEKVAINRDMGRNPLFDVLFVLQNISSVPAEAAEAVAAVSEKRMIEDDNIPRTAKFDLEINAWEVGQRLELGFGYSTKLFKKETVERFITYFKRIVSLVVKAKESGIRIRDIEIISLEEKKQLLCDFNETAAEFPRDKTVHQLFAEQAEKTPDHIAVFGRGRASTTRTNTENNDVETLRATSQQVIQKSLQITYRQLNEQSGRLAGVLIEKGVLLDDIVGIMMERSVEMVIGLLGILKAGGAYLPIDPAYPQERIDYMVKDSGAAVVLTDNCQSSIDNRQLSMRVFRSFQGLHHSNHLAYVIYTSGTTGKPKGVMVMHRGVVNTLLCRRHIYQLDEKVRALQLFSFSFDAFVTSFFNPIIAGGMVVLPSHILILNIDYIKKIIHNIGITHIVSTPSLYSLIINNLSRQEAASLAVVVLGGEHMAADLIEKTKAQNNNTELYVEYGVTEASVMSTLCRPQDLQTIYTIGSPTWNTQIYILDNHNNMQPIGVAGEIWITGEGLARGYLNRVELTAERFIYFPNLLTSKLRTGDLGRWLPNGNIEFLGRIDQQVKIRGFRIELGEIESQLIKHPGIKEAVVLTQEESGDKFLCAYIVSIDERVITGLKEYLAKELPDYMIPSYFVSLEKIPLTPNGKIDQKALPKPNLKASDDYMAPRDEFERKLVDLWSEVLERQAQASIGINDNFFQLGGHSLKATILAAKIHKEFEVKVPLAEIFKAPTIKQLAKYIKEKNKEFYISMEAAEEKEYYELSPAQKRLYILWQLVADNTSYNMPMLMPLAKNVDKEKLERVLKKLIQRHESLRTSFITVNEIPVQRIHRKVDFSIETYEVTAETDTISLISQFTKPFNLDQAPLLRVILATSAVEPSRRFLFIDIHHIITDGTSQGILEKEFHALLKEEDLQPLRLQYKDYSEWYNRLLRQELITQQESYWLKEFPGELPLLDLPTDYPRPTVQGIEGNRVNFDFDSRETAALKEIVKQEEMTPYMALLTIFNILLAKLSGQEDIIIGTPIAARRHADLQNVIGMLVNTLPMRNFPSGDKVLKDFLQEVRLRTLEAYENQEYPFEVLVDKITIARDAGRNPVFDVMFNLLNQADYKEDAFENYEQRRYVHIKGTSKFDMELTAVDMGERLHFTLDYSTHLFKPGRIERFIGYYKNILQVLTRDTGLTIAKIEIMDAGEKEEVLRFSNGIEDSYEELKTIHGWFAEQVHKTPDNIALVGANRHLRACPNCLTYYELNEQADNLASRLREKGVGPDSIVGLMLERSVEMIIGILGIMKAGGAYLPLDIEYPVERIYFTLKDSSVAVLLTADHVLENMPAGFLKTLNTLKKKPFITPARERILDFNSLPLPDRSLVNYEKYHKYISSAMVKHSISIQATRGCPFKCIYCNKICTGKFVQRSAENVFTEIRRCYDFGIRRFTFIDDVFNLDEKNASTLLKTLIKNRMDVQLFFANGLRGDILSKEFIDLMVEAGAATICLALESGSQRLQKLMKKRLNLEKFKDNVHYITQKYPHIILELELIHGFPTETEAEAMETLDFLMDIKWVHFPDLHILKIYPHTDMYRLAVESGITEEQIARSIHLAYHEIPETLPFSKDFTRRYQAKFLSDYFFLKERLLQVLPYQMKILTEDELVQKYDSYLPYDIKSFSDILEYLGISREELGGVELLPIDNMSAPNFSQGMMAEFPGKKKAPGALRLLLLDLSLSFSSEKNSRLYDVVEAPLGLMYLLTYLNEKLGDQVLGKVLKSRIDFDSYEELKEIILDFKPDLVGIRTLSTYKEYFHRSVSLMRKWGVDVPIISGGPYATAEYSVMLQDDNVDLAVLGEGELTIAQLAGEMLKNNKKLPGDEVLKNIPGIAFVKSVDKTKASGKDCQILLMDKMAEESSRYPLENLKNINTPGDLAYLIYTSGSTGIPKGVMLNHGNLVNLIEFDFKYTNMDFNKILQFHTISFDASFHEIFCALLCGGQLVLIDNEVRLNVNELLKVVAKNKIKTLFLPMPFLKIIFSEDYIKSIPRCIAHIQTAGEQVVINNAFNAYLKGNHIYLHNHYGPSETHVVTALTIEPDGDIPELPSIGKPVINTRIYILDKWRHLAPLGVVGEIWIGGVQVGRGYLNRPELTAEKFYKAYRTHKTYINYRTGDLGRWLPDGNIEFLGRIDQQVKIRGFRIELGEIENSLLKINGIKEAVVIAREDETRDKYLCAYIVSKKEVIVTELSGYLSANLPDYMIPSYFVRLEKIPLTPNGKIDRKALPKTWLIAGENYTAPRNEIETKLVELWAEILSKDQAHASHLQTSIGIDDNFFQLGGHSLKATIVMSKIHKEIGVKMDLVQLFKNPTIREIASLIKTIRCASQSLSETNIDEEIIEVKL